MAAPSNPHTPLFADTQHWVRQQLEWIRRTRIEPWVFFKAGPPMRVTTFFEKPIAYQGVKFEGTPQLVFWGRFIEPFLEDLVVKTLDRVAQRAGERGVQIDQAVLEAGSTLKTGAFAIFTRMARIDRVLRADGYPDRVPPRSIEAEVAGMNRFIDAQVSGWASERGAGQGTEDSPTDASPGDVFRQVGESQWEFVYRGMPVQVVSDLVGLQVIKLLLESPGRPIAAKNLRAMSGARSPSVGDVPESRMSSRQLEGEGLSAAGGSYDSTSDSRALQAIDERLQEVDHGLDAARSNNDVGRIDQLEVEREVLLAEVSRSTGLGRRPRGGSTEEERARTWARKAIKRALAKLSSAHPALADHLEEKLKTGRSCVYDCRMTWVTTPKR